MADPEQGQDTPQDQNQSSDFYKGLSPEDNERATHLYSEEQRTSERLAELKADTAMGQGLREYLKTHPRVDYNPNARYFVRIEEVSADAHEPSEYVESYMLQDEATASDPNRPDGKSIYEKVNDQNLERSKRHFYQNEEGYKEQAIIDAQAAGHEVNYPPYTEPTTQSTEVPASPDQPS